MPDSTDASSRRFSSNRTSPDHSLADRSSTDSSSSEDSSSDRIRPSTGPENTLYVDTVGAVVRREHSHFVVDHHTEDSTERACSVPLPEVDTIALVGKVHCTTPAIRFCLQEEVQVVLLSYHGKVKGRLHGAHPASVDVRLGQYEAQSEAARRRSLARRFVGAKIHNMRRRLRRAARKRPSETLDEATQALHKYAQRLSSADTLDGIVGTEGVATKAYFSVWPDLITRTEPELQFTTRTRRPPESAVDALLGFTYSLLQNDVEAACIIAGLDPHLGLLHRPRPHAPTAVLDLMEAFRPAVADSVVLTLLNRGRIDPFDFEPRDGGIYLTKDGRTKVYKAYGQRRADTIAPPGRDQPLPYYRVMELQARRLARALTEEEASYSPFRQP